MIDKHQMVGRDGNLHNVVMLTDYETDIKFENELLTIVTNATEEYKLEIDSLKTEKDWNYMKVYNALSYYADKEIWFVEGDTFSIPECWKQAKTVIDDLDKPSKLLSELADGRKQITTLKSKLAEARNLFADARPESYDKSWSKRRTSFFKATESEGK